MAPEREYLDRKGLDVVLAHAADFIEKRLAPAYPTNDGKQTPMRKHPVFVAQHATATCCRGCLEKWHSHLQGKRAFSRREAIRDRRDPSVVDRPKPAMTPGFSRSSSRDLDRLAQEFRVDGNTKTGTGRHPHHSVLALERRCLAAHGDVGIALEFGEWNGVVECMRRSVPHRDSPGPSPTCAGCTSIPAACAIRATRIERMKPPW